MTTMIVGRGGEVTLPGDVRGRDIMNPLHSHRDQIMNSPFREQALNGHQVVVHTAFGTGLGRVCSDIGHIYPN